MLGLKLAAIYSYPPCKLGFCGTKIKNASKILADFIQGKKISLAKVRRVLENFEASYFYYQLIARANGIKDPFDYKVVEAYWLGNKLLDKVKTTDLKKLVLNKFVGPGLLSKAKPHHSFHVLIIGSITGRVRFTAKVYDLCRIGWGKVIGIKNSKLKVKSRPLLIKNNKFLLGKEIEKEITWDRRFLSDLKLGDVVSFHWNIACQVINKREKENLLKYTLESVNSAGNTRVKSTN